MKENARKIKWREVVGNSLKYVLLVVVVAIIALVGNYIFLPAWSIHSIGMWFFLIVMLLFVAIGFAIVIFFDYDDKSIYRGLRVAVVALIVVLVVGMLLISLFSCPMFNAEKYRHRVTIEEGDFSSEVVAIGEKLSVVDMETAERLGDRTIAKVENATWYDVNNEYNLIKYQGRYYRVSPLNYGGLAKFVKAKNFGIPGYVLVDAQTQEATFVELDTPYKYSPSGYWGWDLKRHVHHQFPNLMLGTPFFEIDEEGQPYWITAVKDATVGLWSNRVEKRFIVTDAVSGESCLYETAELPEWVDHAHDLKYLMDAASDYYLYINGFWNSVFSKTGVQKLSYNYKDNEFAGYTSTITADGEVVFFTAVTPANKAESILGFVQLNPRTGEVKFFNVSGAEESSAQAAAQSLTQNFGYVANYPTVINVNGIPTYFMMLKDSAGLIQRYSLVNVENYAIAVEDTTLNGAMTKYLGKVNPDLPVQETTKTGIIENLYEAQIDGYTYYYFTLNGEDSLYMSSITNSNRQVMLETGTEVTIEYVESSETGVFMVTKISF